MRSPRRQAVLLVVVMGVVALVAQLAGVGGRQAPPATTAAPRASTLAVIAGGAVPDIASTTLASTSTRVAAGDVLRMQATATVTAEALGSADAAQVVCGIRYSRDADPAWTLGTPYETVVLRAGQRTEIPIERSFEAPAADTYRMSTACHVSSPRSGAKVTASGAMRVAAGLPAGAATPVE